MTLLIAESALSDLENLKAYYTEQGLPEIGEKYIKSILKHLDGLKDNPDIGRIVPEFEEKTIREIIHPPFRLVYLRDESQIQIIRIWAVSA